MAMFLLDSTGDFDLSSGRLVVTTDRKIEYKQKVDARLALWQREWYQDRNKGVPWKERVLIKNPNMADVQSLLRSVIMSVPGTTAVYFSTLNFDTKTRKLSGSYRTETDFTDQPIDFNLALDLTQRV
jgi:hypothetical protein